MSYRCAFLLLMLSPVFAQAQKRKLPFGSLGFAYATGKQEAIKEFSAKVYPVGEPGRAVRQPCNEDKLYAVGQYYVEVNSLPITRYHVVIDSNKYTQLFLAEPGTLQIKNDNAAVGVALYYPLGQAYHKFYEPVVAAGYSIQIRLKPGTYEVHSRDKAGTETIITFIIKIGKTTNVTL